MATEAVGKKIGELRVFDLKSELEARSLETTGNKVDLVKRLQQVRDDFFTRYFVIFNLRFDSGIK